MVTNYVANISHWKAWQREYMFGTLMVIPPDPVRSEVNALRAKYKWAQSTDCDAHVSLTIRFPRPLTKLHWNELKLIASNIKSFSIHYGPLKHYLPYPGVCLEIEPQDELDRLRAALEAASCFVGAPERRFPFSAHMTIAECISVEQTEELMVELNDVAPEGVFACTNVSYVVPDASFRFTERAWLELATNKALHMDCTSSCITI